jgi:hypothetical protein
MAVVYEHIRNDTNEVFYVGIGKTPKRPYDKIKRSQYWKNITNKIEYTVNILVNDATYEEAKEIEKYLIAFYGRQDLGLGSLVNMTDGGDGSLGVIVSEDTRKKLSVASKGDKNPMFGKTKEQSPAYGKTMSDKHKQILSEINTGKTHTEETKQKISNALKREKHPMYGKSASEEAKKNMTIAQQTREGVKGYSYRKAINKYYARIKVGGKHIYLGRFNTPSEAEEAYKNARIKYFS